MKKIACVALVSLTLGSCSFIFGDGRDHVEIKTSNNKSAACKIKSGKEIWNITAPSVIRVDKSTKNIKVSCSAKGLFGSKLVKPKEQEGFRGSYEYPEEVIIKMYKPKAKVTKEEEEEFFSDENMDKPLNRLPDAPEAPEAHE